MFICLFSKQEEEEFCQYNSFLYWRAPLPAVDLSDIQNLDEETPSDTKTAARSETTETEMETWAVVSRLRICSQETCFYWDSDFVLWVNNKLAYAVLEKLLWQSLKANTSCLSDGINSIGYLTVSCLEVCSKEEVTVSNKNTWKPAGRLKAEYRKLELWDAIKRNGDMLHVKRKCKIILSVLNKKTCGT